jgi:hypothetical protein
MSADSQDIDWMSLPFSIGVRLAHGLLTLIGVKYQTLKYNIIPWPADPVGDSGENGNNHIHH